MMMRVKMEGKKENRKIGKTDSLSALALLASFGKDVVRLFPQGDEKRCPVLVFGIYGKFVIVLDDRPFLVCYAGKLYFSPKPFLRKFFDTHDDHLVDDMIRQAWSWQSSFG
jgi:hypothetical protein